MRFFSPSSKIQDYFSKRKMDWKFARTNLRKRRYMRYVVSEAASRDKYHRFSEKLLTNFIASRKEIEYSYSGKKSVGR